MHKQIIRGKVRFSTTSGMLTPEQIWDLEIPQLDELAVSLETEYKKSGKRSFVVKKTKKDKELKLKFDFVLDVLTTKVEEAETLSTAQAKKEHNQKIMAKIAALDEKALDGLTREQLLAELK